MVFGQKVPLGLTHLGERMREAGHLQNDQVLTEAGLRVLLDNRIRQVDFSAAEADVRCFIKDPWKIAHWSQSYFLESLANLTTAS